MTIIHCLHGNPRDKCGICAICDRLDVSIAQLQRLLDLQERELGYDNVPQCLFINSPVINIDYKLPVYEMAAITRNLQFVTDCTGIQLGIFLYHESIVGGKQRITTCQGSGNTNFPGVKITIPARGTLGFNFAALTGGTYASFSVDTRRSEQTGIEYFRGQRAGRVG